MRGSESLQSVAYTSPAAASTAVHATLFNGLWRADFITIDAFLLGATGGTLDVYLQRQITTDVWADWVHFTQLAAGAAAIHYAMTITGDATAIATVGGGTDATPALVLASGAYTNLIPGGAVRIVSVAGASTSAGAAQTIYIKSFSANY